ncbi:MAG: hypothetical protein ACXIUW_16440 [Roseinatronobacter sp.]
MAKRDNAYYEKRLKDKNPAIYGNWIDGRYNNLAAALRAAGIKQPRTRIQELKNAWDKATNDEQQEFLKFLKAQGVDCSTAAKAGPGKATSIPSTSVNSLGFPVAANRRLTQEAKDRLTYVANRRKLFAKNGSLRCSVIMSELDPPFGNYDPSLAFALQKGKRIAAEMIEPLEKWLLDHNHL